MKHTALIEKKRHGKSSFPIEFYHVTAEHPRYQMSAHWHRETELIRVQQGSLQLVLENEEYTLSKGDVLVISGGLLHRGQPQDCIYECIVFDPMMLRRNQGDVMEKYLSPIIDLHVEIPCPKLQDGELISLAHSLFSVMAEPSPFYELEIYARLFSLIAGMYRKELLLPTDHSPHKGKAKNIMKLLSWLDQNYAEPLRLETLSERTGLSEKYLCRIFKEYTSKTPIEYITELRIENACIQMTTAKKSITEAAFDSGFNDLSYFSKIFKRYKGITPKEYKNGFSTKN